MDVICIGSAVIDIMAQPVGDSVEWKEKQRIQTIQIQTGGDAANQSSRLADLGLEAAICTCIGSDQNGAMLRASLEERGVSTRYIETKEEVSTGTALVLVDGTGERHTFSVKGAHSLLDRETADCCFDADCRAISLASLFSMPVLERDGLLEGLRRAKERGILIFADLASDKLGQGLEGIRSFLPYIDYFLPSLYDAQEMTGAGSAEEAAHVYLDHGAKNVVVKCGKDGCYFIGKEKSGWVPALPVRPVDTTGAGDCMAALFISQILEGKDMETACRMACAGASYSTLFAGASGGKISRQMIYKMDIYGSRKT